MIILPAWIQSWSETPHNLLWLFLLMFLLTEFTEWVDKRWKE